MVAVVVRKKSFDLWFNVKNGFSCCKNSVNMFCSFFFVIRKSFFFYLSKMFFYKYFFYQNSWDILSKIVSITLPSKTIYHKKNIGILQYLSANHIICEETREKLYTCSRCDEIKKYFLINSLSIEVIMSSY